MLNKNQNLLKAIGGILSAVSLTIMVGGLASCTPEAPEAESETEEVEEQPNQGSNQSEETDDENEAEGDND